MYFSFHEIVLSVCYARVEDSLVERNRSEMEGFEWGRCCGHMLNMNGQNGLG